jgi:hypothetical protein
MQDHGVYPTVTRPMRHAEQPAAPIPDTVDEHDRVGSTKMKQRLPNTDAGGRSKDDQEVMSTPRSISMNSSVSVWQRLSSGLAVLQMPAVAFQFTITVNGAA